jgi:hypothetical protein
MGEWMPSHSWHAPCAQLRQGRELRQRPGCGCSPQNSPGCGMMIAMGDQGREGLGNVEADRTGGGGRGRGHRREVVSPGVVGEGG